MEARKRPDGPVRQLALEWAAMEPGHGGQEEGAEQLVVLSGGEAAMEPGLGGQEEPRS